MTIVLNGTTGITNDGGYTGDGVVFADTTPANTLVTTTGGNVGIGTASPTVSLEIGGAAVAALLKPSTTTNNALYRSTNLGGSAFVGLDSSAGGLTAAYALNLYHSGAYPITFSTSGTERARIDASGSLSIGKTQASESATTGNGFGFASTASDPFLSVVNVNGSGNNACIYLNKRTTGAMQVFLTNNGAANTGTVGSISHNGSSTAYNTSSDYRLKEEVQAMTGALARVAALRPVTYNWKSTGVRSEGFIAHELAAVVPEAVVGEKDAVNEDGSINPQGIDTSFLVATLTAAIQEQQAIITALTARVAALEGTQP